MQQIRGRWGKGVNIYMKIYISTILRNIIMEFKFLQENIQGCYILMLGGSAFQILGPLAFNYFRP